MSSLEQALALIAAGNAQSISVAVHDSHSGERVELRARESMHAASTMKLAVLLAAYRLRVELDRPVRVDNCFTSIADGSPFAVDGRKTTIPGRTCSLAGGALARPARTHDRAFVEPGDQSGDADRVGGASAARLPRPRRDRYPRAPRSGGSEGAREGPGQHRHRPGSRAPPPLRCRPRASRSSRGSNSTGEFPAVCLEARASPTRGATSRATITMPRSSSRKAASRTAGVMTRGFEAKEDAAALVREVRGPSGGR